MPYSLTTTRAETPSDGVVGVGDDTQDRDVIEWHV